MQAHQEAKMLLFNRLTSPILHDINQRYMVDCDGCPSWDICTNCSVLGDVRTPACAPTLDHTTSLESTGTLETLDLEPGYWRITTTSRDILSCFNEEACEGGATVGGYCATGYEGPCKCFVSNVFFCGGAAMGRLFVRAS